MASGTITLTKSGDGYLKGRIVWEATSNGSTKNNSTVTASLQIARSNTGYTTTGTWTGSLNIGGTSKTFSVSKSVTSSWVEVYSFTITKAHNSDGTGTCYIYGKVKGPSGTSMSGTSVSGSKTVDLDTIPRASSVSAAAANIGSATKITISRNSSSFTHTLTYSFKGDSTTALTGTIATKTADTSISWIVPTSFYAKIPNAKSATCTITCETFSGSTSIGSKTTTFTATAAESSCKPTLNPTVIDTGSVSIVLTGDPENKLIKGFNNMSVDSGAAARNSATLKSYKITCGDKSITTASGKLGYVTSNKFTFSVTDSRGYTTTQTVTKTMVNYVELTCSLSNTSFNTDGVIAFGIKGNYFNGSFGATNNSLTVEYRYKVSGGSYGSWTAATATVTNNTYTANVSISGLDYQSKYVIEVRAVDKIRTITPDAKTMSCIPVFDWGEDDFNFNVPVTMNWNGYSYDLLGLFRAMTTTYTPECTVTPGDNYSSVSVTAHLTGCNLRIGLSATRNASLAAGNFDNETVCTVDIDHGGKLANLYRVSFNTSTSGGVATLDCQASKVSDNVVRLTIYLCAAAQPLTSFNAYFAMPCTIITKAYV